jgi:hypothetical protein
MFTAHIKTKKHGEWLEGLNANKVNYFIENKKLRDLAQSQKIMIVKMQVELANKDRIIDNLTNGPFVI